MTYKKDKHFLTILLLVTLGIYFIIPPHNKIAQIQYLCNNIQMALSNNETEEYIFHRNNAIYLTKMNNKQGAIREMDMSVYTLPSDKPDGILYQLYRDRANIKMYYGDYKGALNDFLRLPNLGLKDYLTVAMLLKENGKKQLAVSYCNKIIDIDIKAYAGYACIADIYASAGKYDASVMIYDLLIDRVKNNSKYYADRAMYKEKAGDFEGAQQDHEKAKELSPFVDYDSSITYDAIHPKKFDLPIYKSL